jgi:hypothetical protein
MAYKHSTVIVRTVTAHGDNKRSQLRNITLIHSHKALFQSQENRFMKRWNSKVGISSLLFLFAMGCGGQEAMKGIGDSNAWKVIAESDQSVEEILAHHAEARGGAEALASLVSLKKDGKLNSRAGSDIPVTNTMRYPDRYLRLVSQLEGGKYVKIAYDGTVAWELSPEIGYDEPTPKNDIEQREIKHNADPTGPLVSPQEKGYSVEVQGKTEKGYRLRVDFNDGGERFYLLDPDTYLVARYYEVRNIQGRLTAETEIFLRDYREVDGVKFAAFVETSIPAVDFSQTVFWETIETNVEIEDTKFMMP